MWIRGKPKDWKFSVKGLWQFSSLAGLSSTNVLALSNQGRRAEEWSWRIERVLKLCKCNIEGSHVPCCLAGTKYLEEKQIFTNLNQQIVEHVPGLNVWNGKRGAPTTMPDDGYIFFIFHKMAWLQLRYTADLMPLHNLLYSFYSAVLQNYVAYFLNIFASTFPELISR